jgi:hypothetical protein
VYIFANLYVYTYWNTFLYRTYTNIYINVQIPILRTVHACTYTCTNTYT